jgi:hypothetical protein
MPSGKSLAWTAAIALAVVLGLQHYQQAKGK